MPRGFAPTLTGTRGTTHGCFLLRTDQFEQRNAPFNARDQPQSSDSATGASTSPVSVGVEANAPHSTTVPERHRSARSTAVCFTMRTAPSV